MKTGNISGVRWCVAVGQISSEFDTSARSFLMDDATTRLSRVLDVQDMLGELPSRDARMLLLMFVLCSVIVRPWSSEEGILLVVVVAVRHLLYHRPVSQAPPINVPRVAIQSYLGFLEINPRASRSGLIYAWKSFSC